MSRYRDLQIQWVKICHICLIEELFYSYPPQECDCKHNSHFKVIVKNWVWDVILLIFGQRSVIFFFIVHMQDYPKLSQSYYALVECLAQDHMSFISSLEPQVFLYILSTISEGLTALGRSV